jgi:hypothetical protein
MLLDRLLRLLTFTAHADAEDHLRSDRKQQEAAGDAERRERDFERIEEPVANERGADQDRSGDDAGARPDAAPRALRQPVGDREKGRGEPNRITTNSVNSAETA